MRFEQTRNILQRLAPEYHRQVSKYYQQLAAGEVSPRVRLMLDYLIDHEQQRALALGEFCNDTPYQVLEHWLKGLEANFPVVQAELLEAGAATDLDLLIKAAVGFKRPLIEYFSHACEHCSDEQTSYLFDKLKLQEEKAMKRMIRHAQGLADL
ncbi:aminoglycoside phosphotransferase [Malonomonas rubra]|uniref:aminoglycoside phosphotransferase n=1 Tax=Malonomonas rubra TaxID=57040 RepID=UPI0026EB882D|nr:aminoglycoside phosphotransferase [Malonomonas rubra]